MNKAALFCREYCLSIIDGANQPDFGTSYFEIFNEAARCHWLQIMKIGALEHSKPISLLLTMTGSYCTDANHIVEDPHRFHIDNFYFSTPNLFAVWQLHQKLSPRLHRASYSP